MNILSAEEKKARKAEARRRLAEAIPYGDALTAGQRQAIKDAAQYMAMVCAEDALDDALDADALFDEMGFMEFDWVFEGDYERSLAGMRKMAGALRRALLAQAEIHV